jgi:hypothetical protein
VELEAAIKAKLEAVLGHGRIYPDGAIPTSQTEWPCVAYEHSGNDDRITLCGRAKTRVDEFDLRVIGKTRLSVAATRRQLFEAFDGYGARGLWGGDGGIRVSGAVAKEPIADAELIEATEELIRSERVVLRVHWRVTDEQ